MAKSCMITPVVISKKIWPGPKRDFEDAPACTRK